MTSIRVLVVDDAVIVRRLVAKALEADPEFQVVGTASDGPLALQKIQELSPDVVTLDLDMPEMDGLKVLAEIRRRWRSLPAVIFTGMSEPGPAELEALALGANECIVKVPHEGNMVHALKWVQETLGPRLKAIVAEWQLTVRSAAVPARPPAPPVTAPATVAQSPGAPPAPAAPAPHASRTPPLARPPVRSTPPEVLVVAASTGGPNALEAILADLPADFPLPVLVVQHMPVGFTALLAERLRSRCRLDAREAESGIPLAPGTIWVAPADRHLVVQRVGSFVHLQLNREAPENSCRPAADPLFRSAAKAWGPGVLGVVLTGMGQDGMLGAGALVAAGGTVLAQDEATSVVWGMPGAVVRAGHAAAVLPLGGIAPEILRRTLALRRAAAPA